MFIVNSKWEPLRSKSSIFYGHYKVLKLLTKLHCMKLVLQEIKFIFPNMSVHHTVNTICFKLHLHLKYTKYIIIIIILFFCYWMNFPQACIQSFWIAPILHAILHSHTHTFTCTPPLVHSWFQLPCFIPSAIFYFICNHVSLPSV